MQRTFFEGLKNTAWLLDLEAAGFFNDPPEPIVDEGGGTVQYRAWPQMVYLRHVALNGGLKEKNLALRIVAGIRTDDPYVRADILCIAAKIDAESADQLVRSQFKWLKSQSEVWLSVDDHVIQIVHTLLNAGRTGTAVNLLKIVAGVRKGSGPSGGSREKVTSRLKDYDFTKVWLGVAPALGAMGEDAGFRLVLGELERALGFENPNPEFERDMSEIATREIRPSVPDVMADVVSTLALALLECSIAACQRRPLTEVVTELLASPWHTVKRVAVQLLAEKADAGIDFVVEHLVLNDLFSEDAPPETWNLLRTHWSRLPQSWRDEYLERTNNVPDERINKWRSQYPEEVDRLSHGWRMTYVHRIRHQLTAQEFEACETSLEEIESWARENVGPPAGVAVGVQSPRNSDELLAMKPAELIEYLNNWAPGHGNWWLDRYALAGQWRDASTKSPDTVLALGQSLRSLKPEMLEEAASGVAQAIKNGARPDMAALREMIGAMTDVAERRVGKDFDRALLSLLESLLKARGELLSNEDSGLVWAVLTKYLVDEDPTIEHEAEYGPPNMDWFTLALNTIRPKALRLVIEFALWQKSALGSNSLDAKVAIVLNEHLDLGREPSLGVRSTYGALLPQLYFLDKEWLIDHLHVIFPKKDELRLYFIAAFEAYILYSRFYTDLFPVIREPYERAVELVNDPNWDNSRGERTVIRLVEHLQAGYIHGLIEVDNPTLQSFYMNAKAEIRKEALVHLGFDLMRLEGKIEPESRERFMRFWEFITSEVFEKLDSRSEYAAFGRWFESGLFPPEWSLGHLQIALSKCGVLDDSHGVMEKLAELSAKYPAGVLPVFEHIISNPESIWALGMWRESAAIIIQNLLRSEDPEVARRTEVARNRLGSRGLLHLGDIAN
jgi:hypothetical protein